MGSNAGLAAALTAAIDASSSFLGNQGRTGTSVSWQWLR
jgi:hypothetical protein